MVLKTGSMRKPENEVIPISLGCFLNFKINHIKGCIHGLKNRIGECFTYHWFDRGPISGRTNDIINNLINIF